MSHTKNDKTLAISVYIITGTLLLFALKFQSAQTVTEGGQQKKFFHPYMQSFTIFLGETLYILIYLGQRRQWRQVSGVVRKPHTSRIFFIPAVADVFTSVLQMVGLNFIPGSTFLMFKGSAIVTTMLFSKILLKKRLQKRHYTGCCLTLIGMAIVASSSALEPHSQNSHNQLIGYLLMLISIIFNGFFYAYEEYLLTHYHINFYQMVAYQGIYGSSIILCLTVALSYVPCDLGERVCVYNVDGGAYYELPLVYLRELGDNWVLLMFTVFGILLIGLFILNGIKITKMFDALTKSIINISKTTVVWLVGILLTILGPDDPQFMLESLNLGVNLMKAGGFCIIICGNLIYNRIILKKYFPQTTLTIEQSTSTQTQKLSPQKSDSPDNTRVEALDEDSILQNLMMVKEDQIQ